jgi:hypothetical protein
MVAVQRINIARSLAPISCFYIVFFDFLVLSYDRLAYVGLIFYPYTHTKGLGRKIITRRGVDP